MSDIAEKIDQLLADDKNFTTRSGLRFTLEVLQGAIQVNEKATAQIETFQDQQEHIEDRIKNVEKWQEEFSAMRAKEKEHDESERTRWRWAIIGPSIVMVLGELAYFLNWVIKTLAAALGH